MRFKAGDACAAFWGRVMTLALSEHVRVIGQQPLQGRNTRASLGRAERWCEILASFSWRWSSCHEDVLGIARTTIDGPMRLA